MGNIIQIVVHNNPHLDELVAVWLLRNYGEQKFPEISRAKLVAWGKKDLARTPPEMAAMGGILLVGLGGGMFDDHVDGRRLECATTLVAKHLEKADCPLLRRLLRGVFQADAEADGPLKWLADRVQGLNRYWCGSMDLEKLYHQVESDIMVEIERQKEYLAAKDRFAGCYHQRISGIEIAAADKMDNCQFQHVARSAGVHIIVQRNSDGLTQILTGGKVTMDLIDLAVRIRKAEIVKGGLRPRHFLNDKDLSVNGTVSEIPQWYFEEGMLLNGSESFSDVPPSSIPFRDIVHLVERYVTEARRPKVTVETKE